MVASSRSSDVGGKSASPITKASGSTNITPAINTNPDLTEITGQDVDEYGPGELCYPENGTNKDDPVA